MKLKYTCIKLELNHNAWLVFEILQDTYKLYLPLDTRIKPQDRILIDGITYAIIGTPMRMNHFIKVSHTKVIIQRFRKELE